MYLDPASEASSFLVPLDQLGLSQPVAARLQALGLGSAQEVAAHPDLWKEGHGQFFAGDVLAALRHHGLQPQG